MSENIVATKFTKIGKGYNKPFTVKQMDGGSDGVSQEAHKSEATKVSAVAAVSPVVDVPDTSRSIQTFSLQYDRLFAEFKEELIMEYGQMRGCYMGEYEENFVMNTNRKNERISDMNKVIQSQIEYIGELQGIQDMKEALMRRFFDKQREYFLYRECFRNMKYYCQVSRRNKRLTRAIAKKTLLRRKQ